MPPRHSLSYSTELVVERIGAIKNHQSPTQKSWYISVLQGSRSQNFLRSFYNQHVSNLIFCVLLALALVLLFGQLVSVMLVTHGVSIAMLNSVVNALCDPLRKYLTKFMDPFTVVATRGLIQAPLFCLWALIDTGGKLPPLNHLFWTSVCISGCINIITSYLYNRSIQISTLSATIPFLSFTPAFLVVVGFLVLGEVPTLSGIVGISIAMLGGFWLQGAKDDQVTKDFPLDNGDPSKGSLYMILVAFLWSISNAFDKIGVQNSTPLVYGAAIQVIVALGSYIFQKLRVGGEELYQPLGTEVKIPWKFVVLAGITSIVAYYINLVATQNLEVSYVIAIKRSGCIWSVLMGKFLFREKNLRRKIPSILLMVLGVVCIVLGKE